MELERAARLGRTNPRFAYVYAVALNDSGQQALAIHVLEQTQGRYPGNVEVLTFLVQLSHDAHDAEAARRWARTLADAAPNNPAVQQFVQAVEQAGR